MVEALKIRAIYNDFLTKVHLTNEQVKILDMMINKEKIIKISMEIGMSPRTVNSEIRKIKNLYENYKQLEIAKLKMLDK